MRLPALLLPLLFLPAGCLHHSHPEDTPWCTQAVTLAAGRLYTTGVLEEPRGEKVHRRYLPTARDGKRCGIALARLPDGRVVVCDLVRWGPADRAGFRPGQVVLTGEVDLERVVRRLGKRPVAVWDGNRIRVLWLHPGKHLAGHAVTHLPPLLSLGGDAAHLDLSLVLGVAGFAWRRVETAPGELAHRVAFRLLWGLITL